MSSIGAQPLERTAYFLDDGVPTLHSKHEKRSGCGSCRRIGRIGHQGGQGEAGWKRVPSIRSSRLKGCEDGGSGEGCAGRETRTTTSRACEGPKHASAQTRNTANASPDDGLADRTGTTVACDAPHSASTHTHSPKPTATDVSNAGRSQHPQSGPSSDTRKAKSGKRPAQVQSNDGRTRRGNEKKAGSDTASLRLRGSEDG